MAKKTNRTPLLVLIVLILAAGGFYLFKHKAPPPEPAAAKTEPKAPSPAPVPASRVDPANDGKVVTIEGPLTVLSPARDTQLGIEADGVMLLRYVEMLQWREQCGGERCTYQTVWSPQIINSRKFREPEGHKNPERMPMTTARFSSADVRLGGFRIDAAMIGNYRLGAGLQTRPVPLPVTAAQLPSNLATSFRDFKGALYAGNDPEHPAPGDLRVSYRVIPHGEVQLTGVQRGDRLIVQKSVALNANPNPQEKK